MKYLVVGMGGYVAGEFADYLPLPKKNQKLVTEVVEAKSKEDALHKAYETCEDGFWKGETFVWFAEEPTITPVPEDQMMKAIGAPMLPGFNA